MTYKLEIVQNVEIQYEVTIEMDKALDIDNVLDDVEVRMHEGDTVDDYIYHLQSKYRATLVEKSETDCNYTVECEGYDSI